MKYCPAAFATPSSTPHVEAQLRPYTGLISPAGPVRMDSQTLFSGAYEIEIEHKGSIYRLRQTSLGKLILTK